MGCIERQRLQEQWVAKHDRLCQALEEYERKLAALEQLDRLQPVDPKARVACDQARDALDQHELDHGCLTSS